MIEEVLLNGAPIEIDQAKKYIYDMAIYTGYDPAEVDGLWGRLTGLDYEDALDAASELEAIDLESAIEFFLEEPDES